MRRFFVLFLGLTLSSNLSIAATSMTVVGNLSEAANTELWKKVDKDRVPESLLSKETVANPSQAYKAPYTKAFLQNERMVVCYVSCEAKQRLKVIKTSGSDFTVDASDMASIRMTNVYFWVNKLFDRLEALGFKPSRQLKVVVDREIGDPASGVDMRNNAFFNDRDWSLSFLPDGKSISMKLSGLNPGPSANDATVAMHETAHSVFAELIGEIINPEVLGLHEAFADYLAMVVVDSPHIGQVMMRGKPLRSADLPRPYFQKMEAHALGNVVASALWRIREIIGDKNLADSIALQTIKIAGQSPYISAGDVSSAYLDAAKQSGAVSSALLARIEAQWKQALLIPTSFDFDQTQIAAPPTARELIRLNIQLDVPELTTKEFGLQSQKIVLQKGEVRSSSSEKGADWVNFQTKINGGPLSNLWLYFDKKDLSIHGAFDVNGLSPITSQNTQMANVKVISETIAELMQPEGKDFGQEALEMFKLKIPLVITTTNDRVASETKMTINGLDLTVTERARDIKVKMLGKLVGSLAGPEAKAMLKAVKTVSLFTVPATAFSSDKLPITLENETIIGYRLVTGAGIVQTVIVEDIR